MSFAEGTTVPVEKSRAEIEALLRKYGADQFASGWTDRDAKIQFRARERYVRFVLLLPDPASKAFTRHPQHPWKERSKDAAQKAYETEVRRLWRALLLVIKAKLESVDSKIATFENEFMANIVMPDGKTVAEHAGPMIEAAYKSGKIQALLPGW